MAFDCANVCAPCPYTYIMSRVHRSIGCVGVIIMFWQGSTMFTALGIAATIKYHDSSMVLCAIYVISVVLCGASNFLSVACCWLLVRLFYWALGHLIRELKWCVLWLIKIAHSVRANVISNHLREYTSLSVLSMSIDLKQKGRRSNPKLAHKMLGIIQMQAIVTARTHSNFATEHTAQQSTAPHFYSGKWMKTTVAKNKSKHGFE